MGKCWEARCTEELAQLLPVQVWPLPMSQARSSPDLIHSACLAVGRLCHLSLAAL